MGRSKRRTGIAEEDIAIFCRFYSEYFIGLLYLQLESLALAEAHFTEAMNANPDKGEAFLQLGRIYLFRPAENAKERVANALRAEEYLKKAVACLVQADDLGARFNVNRMRGKNTQTNTAIYHFPQTNPPPTKPASSFPQITPTSASNPSPTPSTTTSASAISA